MQKINMVEAQTLVMDIDDFKERWTVQSKQGERNGRNLSAALIRPNDSQDDRSFCPGQRLLMLKALRGFFLSTDKWSINTLVAAYYEKRRTCASNRITSKALIVPPEAPRSATAGK